TLRNGLLHRGEKCRQNIRNAMHHRRVSLLGRGRPNRPVRSCNYRSQGWPTPRNASSGGVGRSPGETELGMAEGFGV
ncbi:MAG: hypothetical protein WCB27_26010, partial [Thermoguttaceae bacterium]